MYVLSRTQDMLDGSLDIRVQMSGIDDLNILAPADFQKTITDILKLLANAFPSMTGDPERSPVRLQSRILHFEFTQ